MKARHGLLAFAFMVSAGACQADTILLGHLSVIMNGEEYSFDVSESDTMGTDRSLTIRCVRGCAVAQHHAERAPGYPIGFFRLTDSYPLVLVTWGGATTTTLQVFHLEGGRIDKVLERRSSGPPTVSEIGGQLTIMTAEFDQEGAGANRRLVPHSWSWSGEVFVRTPALTPPAQSGDTTRN